MYKKVTLKNRLRIITVPQKTSKAVTVLVLIGTGSKYENRKNNGISHFLEHMFFKGTKRRPSPIAVAETLDKVGGIFNAFTGEEYTGYFAKVESSKMELSLDWVADIFLNSTLPQNEVRKEKGVIVEEINMIEDHPMNYVQVLWNRVLFGDQPAGWDIAGTKENVMGMTRQQLFNYRKAQYVAPNTILCFAGNVDSEKAVRLGKKYFSKMSAASPMEKPKVVENQTRPRALVQYRKTGQAHLCLGVRGYNLFHPDRYTAEILGAILGGMMSSRLFVEIREKLGLAYYVRTSVDSDPDSGSLVTQAGVDNQNIEKAISTILREYRKISRKGVSAAELKKAKDNVKGKTALLLESSDALASFYAGQELLEKRILTLEQVFKIVDKINTKDIARVARDLFKLKNLNLALIGPFRDRAKFEGMLKL